MIWKCTNRGFETWYVSARLRYSDPREKHKRTGDEAGQSKTRLEKKQPKPQTPNPAAVSDKYCEITNVCSQYKW